LTESQQIPDKPRHPWCLTSLSVCFRTAFSGGETLGCVVPEVRGVPSRLNGAGAGCARRTAPEFVSLLGSDPMMLCLMLSGGPPLRDMDIASRMPRPAATRLGPAPYRELMQLQRIALLDFFGPRSRPRLPEWPVGKRIHSSTPTGRDIPKPGSVLGALKIFEGRLSKKVRAAAP